MKSSGQRAIEVWADWEGLPQKLLVGILYVSPGRGKEIFSFEYDRDWLQQGPSQALDPALYLFTGPQHPREEQANFGMFLDSSPDRWGRVLMDRREAQAARTERRTRRPLFESDYLLGVHDASRVGALRFRGEPDGPFLDEDTEFASPPWTSLRELENASLQLERPGSEEERDYARWLRMLIAPGGSLGGARPKAGVRDENEHLWIAKFPSSRDNIDIGAWEFVAHTLAVRSSILTPEAQARRFGVDPHLSRHNHHTFLIKRFDRTPIGERIHFASAMTLLNRTDGDDASTGASYLELAEFLMKEGAQTERDLEQLWRRIVFSICISNTDDHLRNHGFLLVPGSGWRLSPAYDMNPVAYSSGLKLNISDVDNAQDLDLAREVADYYRVKAHRAQEIISEVVTAVQQWRDVATAQGISRREQEEMEPAFFVADAAT